MGLGEVRTRRANMSRVFLGMEIGDSFIVDKEDRSFRQLQRLVDWHEERWKRQFKIEMYGQQSFKVTREG
jgi:hypothetical protein